MVIGIDAYILSKKVITGIGRYTLEMVKALSKNTNVSIILFSPQKLQNDIKSQLDSNIKIVEFNLSNKVLHIFWYIFLHKIISKYNLDYFWGPSHKLPKKQKDIKYIVTIHDLVYKVYPNTLMRKTRLLDTFRVPQSIKKANIILTVSDSTKNDVIKYFGDNNKVHRVYLGNSFTNVKTRESNIDQKYILFVGTVEPRKNIENLVRAYSKLSQDIKNKYKLLIVGAKGWGKVDLDSLLDSLNLNTNVKVYNYITNEELASLYKTASLFVYPSLYEGFGLPILEAMSYGVPVICSKTSSMPEVLGDAGILIDPQNYYSVAEEIQKVLDNDDLQSQMSMMSLMRSKYFSWDKAAAEMYDILVSEML
ncbi:glycosyltransferase family 4 protein [Francisella philomiragia]|uniref:glycosyltransferase family 4 protein n=1 Tax=Francisella philomiragia TaxID=28110 RepID=UPI001905C771|nr:glycosyltransferase family 1 protein [Francisella philomiragia]MBK2024965.1 glycosyltransferase family 4 protein [Francisella philomiragia]